MAGCYSGVTAEVAFTVLPNSCVGAPAVPPTFVQLLAVQGASVPGQLGVFWNHM